MSRPKLKKTRKEIEAQITKWRNASNAKRKKLYAESSEYREKVNRDKRGYYRDRVGFEVRKSVAPAQVADYGELRQVLTEKGGKRTMNVFTVEAMARVLGDYHRVVLYRWLRSNRFPWPQHEALPLGKGPSQRVYTLQEAIALAKTFTIHQKDRLYLRSTDHDTIYRLFNSVGQDPPQYIIESMTAA